MIDHAPFNPGSICLSAVCTYSKQAVGVARGCGVEEVPMHRIFSNFFLIFHFTLLFPVKNNKNTSFDPSITVKLSRSSIRLHQKMKHQTEWAFEKPDKGVCVWVVPMTEF